MTDNAVIADGEEFDEHEVQLADKVRFITRGVTPEEKAAAIVALDILVEEESAIEHGSADGGESMWDKRRRGLRENQWLTRDFADDFTD